MDQHGIDRLCGCGSNRSASASEIAAVVYSTAQLPSSIVGALHPPVHESDSLTLVVDNHVAPSAQTVIELYVALGY